MKLNTKLYLNEEQNIEFIKALEKRIESFLWVPVLFLLLFQVYNITYVSIYTNFQFQSQASRVYLMLYLMMAVVCMTSLLYLLYYMKVKEKKSGKLLIVQNIFVVFLLLWSVGITLYDQRVSSSISIYITAMLSIAVFAYMPPKLFVPLYLLVQILLLVGVTTFGFPPKEDIYGIFVNSIWMTLVALFISFYHYINERKSFLSLCIISEKNQEILEKSEELDFIANHDSLTGLWNRRSLVTYLQNMIVHKQLDPVGVFMIDIDDFKRYNDTFGHLQGDDCLKRIANALNLCVSNGKLFRYGGEEFVYILLDADKTAVVEKGNEFIECIQSLQISTADMNKYVSVSIGCSLGCISDRNAWNSLLNKADEALYQAKSEGKNKSVFLS